MRKFFSRLLKFNGSSKKFLLIFTLAIFLGLFGLAYPAEAGLSSYIWRALAWIGEVFLNLEGKLLLWVINFLIIVSGYNNFLNAPVVSTGWKLVRDVANMFFILVMLVIAFGTMLNLEKYSWKKLLPRMVFMIFLINFSKTIIGLLIDFGQVIMLTFVNAFAAVAGGNFVQMFQMDSVMKLSQANLDAANYDVDMQAMYGALGVFLGVIVMGVALIVVTIFAMILLFRILTLWMLIIISPLIFLLGTFEKGREYYSDWWRELVNSIIVGPLVAFFLWLALATMGQGNNISQLKGDNNALKNLASEDEQYYNKVQIAGTEIGQWENLGSFVVGVALLFAALQRIQKLGVAGAGLASGAANWMKKTAGTAVKKAIIPAALTMYTGGGIPSAMLLRGGGRMGMDFAQRLPLVGGAFKAIRKGADQYGLGQSGKIVKGMEVPILKGITTGAGELEGKFKRKAAEQARPATEYVGGVKEAVASAQGIKGKFQAAVSEIKARGTTGAKEALKGGAKAILPGLVGVAGGVTAGGARQMESEVLGEERKAAREGVDQRKELERQERVDAAAKGKYTPFADKGNQRLYSDQSFVLKDARARKMMQQKYPQEFEEMISGFQNLADKTGNNEDAAKLLKEVYKSDPQLMPPEPEKGTPGTPGYKPAKTSQQRIHEMVTGGDGLSLSPDSLSKPEVIRELSTAQKEKILQKGDADQQRALGLSLLSEKTGIDRGELDRASATNQPANLEGSVDAVLAQLPEGAFKQLNNIFDLLSSGLKAKVVAAGNPEVVESQHIIDMTGMVTPQGQELAKQIAGSGNDEAIQQIASRLGDQFKEALAAAHAASPLDARALNVLASMQRNTQDMINLFRTGGILDTNRLAAAIKASNAQLLLKKMEPRAVIDPTTNTATAEGRTIYNNISISMLSKIIGEAKKPGASNALKETVASIAALVEKAHDSGARGLSSTEEKQLKKLLESQSTIEAIDIASKSGAAL